MRKEKEGVEELKRKVCETGEKKQPSKCSTLGQKPGSTHMLLVVTKVMPVLKTRRHGPSDALHHPSQPLRYLSKDICFISHGEHYIIYRPLTPRCVDIEKVALCSMSPTTKTKTHIIESRAMRFIKIYRQEHFQNDTLVFVKKDTSCKSLNEILRSCHPHQ